MKKNQTNNEMILMHWILLCYTVEFRFAHSKKKESWKSAELRNMQMCLFGGGQHPTFKFESTPRAYSRDITHYFFKLSIFSIGKWNKFKLLSLQNEKKAMSKGRIKDEQG